MQTILYKEDDGREDSSEGLFHARINTVCPKTEEVAKERVRHALWSYTPCCMHNSVQTCHHGAPAYSIVRHSSFCSMIEERLVVGWTGISLSKVQVQLHSCSASSSDAVRRV